MYAFEEFDDVEYTLFHSLHDGFLSISSIVSIVSSMNV